MKNYEDVMQSEAERTGINDIRPENVFEILN